MQSLRLALALLTRIPVRLTTPVTAADHGRAVAAYPFVGALLGGVLMGLAWLAVHSGLPVWPVAIVLVTVQVVLTGALHLDGLADSADAWLGGQGDRERTLRIMKDPACGPAGVCALLLVLLGRCAALATLLTLATELTTTLVLMPLLLAPILGRSACAALFLSLPYVRAGGLGQDAAATLPRQRVSLMLALAALATVLLGGWVGALMLGITLVVFLLARRQMQQKLGGFTGDTAGALVEITETLVLLGAALWLGRG
ncbi:adenosylcobinamide-GDP ribazoletransferase [Alcanivorax sp. JB21]|uniref:adenosylcobinamide-GDP ribazoletransferase n=1 Tax=Alcanivorax limicola TaxID=2874102 RepID=UPI001CBB46C3|nr:adenosylcobinamide-GDP ribazoletransferase [Alcanivorax limicola]MBZ2190382.1 adenosylcobinamide-GDP ribazoletransferase [Alcanivorax limicola]